MPSPNGGSFLRALAGSLMAATLTGAAAGQPAEPPIPEPPEVATPPAGSERRASWELTLPSTVVFNTEFDDEPGDLSIYRTGLKLKSSMPSGERARFDVGLEYEYSAYEFSDATGFIEGADEPWSDVHRISLSALYAAQVSARWGWIVGASGTFAGEEGAEFSDSLTGAIFGGPRYSFTPDLTLGFGAAVRTRLEDSPLVLPFVQLDWKFADRWTLSTTGPGVVLGFQPNERWTLSAGVGWELRDFRLDDDGDLPGGVVSEERFPISFGILFKATDQIRIGLGAGVYVGQNFEVENEDGDEIADIDADATPFLSLEFSYRF